MLTLYFAPGASSMAPHIALHELTAPFDGIAVSFERKENRTPEFLALNPQGTVPVLVIDGRPLTEVAAILYYLARLYPEVGLLPAASIEDEAKAARAAEILALIGLINLPVIKFSVDWWNTLHQGESIFRVGGPLIAPVYLTPLALMGAGYLAAFGALWLVRTRSEIRRRRSLALTLRTALSA